MERGGLHRGSNTTLGIRDEGGNEVDPCRACFNKVRAEEGMDGVDGSEVVKVKNDGGVGGRLGHGIPGEEVGWFAKDDGGLAGDLKVSRVNRGEGHVGRSCGRLRGRG